MSKEIVEALRLLEQEKGIDFQVLLTALEDALLSAYKKTPEAVEFAKVEINPDDGEIAIYELILPDHPPTLPPPAEAEAPEAGGEAAEGEEAAEAGEEEELVPDPSMYDESEIEKVRIETPEDFGRIAAQTAKQVILQRIREAERGMMYEEYKDRIGEIVTGLVQQSNRQYTLIDLGRVEALLPKEEQVSSERYDHGSRIKAVISEVRDQTKGPQVIVSRASEELVRKLFELEVPEVADGLVVIRSVAREPGYRSKIAVESLDDSIDPVGACVGPRGSRVRMVVSELRGEKIDIIPYNEDPAYFVANALSPAKVLRVWLQEDGADEEGEAAAEGEGEGEEKKKAATVVVPDDQLSLAIGNKGQNVRLAHKLTGWHIDIISDSKMAEEEESAEEEVEELDGRCAALTQSGKRCPNAALPGSRYCGIPAHQALAEQEEAGEEAEAAAETAEPEDETGAADEAPATDTETAAPGDAVDTGEDGAGDGEEAPAAGDGAAVTAPEASEDQEE